MSRAIQDILREFREVSAEHTRLWNARKYTVESDDTKQKRLALMRRKKALKQELQTKQLKLF